MPEMFKKADIKAGYLLRVSREDDCKSIYMTVVPCRGLKAPPFVRASMGDSVPKEDGDLACCGGGEFWPLTEFDDQLRDRVSHWRVTAVYGYAPPKFLLDNNPEERELLWKLDDRGEKKAMISQPMAGKSDQEIAAARDAAMKVLTRKGYAVVNTLFTDEWYSKEAMEERGVVQIPLCFLAKSLENMSKCHVAYFCKGWENARGCRIEHQAAKDYGLEIIYEDEHEREI